MKNFHAPLPSTQRGATLVIALLILVMIMMYGIPAAMDSMQNERMTGNTRQRDLAFQAAEHALKKAEAWIMTETATSLNDLAPASAACPSGNTDPNSTDCIRIDGQCHANDVAYWQSSFNWNSSEVCVPTGLGNQIDSELVADQPRYVVERMPTVTELGPPVVTKHYYRITARGIGKDSNAIVILQTMYEFTE